MASENHANGLSYSCGFVSIRGLKFRAWRYGRVVHVDARQAQWDIDSLFYLCLSAFICGKVFPRNSVLLSVIILFFQQVYLSSMLITAWHKITYEAKFLKRIFRQFLCPSVVNRRGSTTEGHGFSRKRTCSMRYKKTPFVNERATGYSRSFAFIRGSNLFRFLLNQFARICVNLRFPSFGCGQRLL